jgi:hypothetical protein
MRYPKGTIHVNNPRDIALLRSVLHNRIISRRQLFELSVLNHGERSPECFAWRVGRMVRHGLVAEHSLALSPPDSRVYTITEIGMANLELSGQYFSWVLPVTPNELEEANVIHTLEVCNVQLALQHAGLLIHWISGHRLRSNYDNESTDYAKVYDAVAEISIGQRVRKIGIEYERTQKQVQKYIDIASRLESERSVDIILYLMPNYELIENVSHHFSSGRLNVVFCLIQEFKKDLLMAQAYTAKGIRRVRLLDLFTGKSEPARM